MSTQETRPKLKVDLVGEQELVLERVFHAPRELVFRAWTDAEALKQWWGPRVYPTTYCTVDLRVGGAWHYMMLGPNGEEAWGKAIYDEITPPERLVYRDWFSNAAGDLVPPESTITVTFTDHGGGKTLLRSVSHYASAEGRQQVLEMGVVEGIGETLDRLDEYLAR